GREGANGTRRFRSHRIRGRVHSAGDTPLREERRRGSDTTQGGREATGREETGEPSDGRASSGDPTCEEREEPAGRQAGDESAGAAGGGGGGGRKGSRPSRARGAVGVRESEVAVLLVGTVPAASLEELESESDLARRDAESMVGDQLPGGTVAMPEQDRVDEFAGALGVERSPDAPLRGSAEILDRRDRPRGGRKPSPTLCREAAAGRSAMADMTMKETLPHTVASSPATIEIRLSRPQQLFNSLDPSPFHERDLDQDAEDYLVDSADEFPLKKPLT